MVFPSLTGICKRLQVSSYLRSELRASRRARAERSAVSKAPQSNEYVVRNTTNAKTGDNGAIADAAVHTCSYLSLTHSKPWQPAQTFNAQAPVTSHDYCVLACRCVAAWRGCTRWAVVDVACQVHATQVGLCGLSMHQAACVQQAKDGCVLAPQQLPRVKIVERRRWQRQHAALVRLWWCLCVWVWVRQGLVSRAGASVVR